MLSVALKFNLNRILSSSLHQCVKVTLSFKSSICLCGCVYVSQQQVNGEGVMGSCQVSVSLRKALLNPVTCLQFQKFLSVCGDLLENDLLFWLEVQRYKVRLYTHSHTL